MDEPSVTEVAEGLGFPEGPVWDRADGSILVTEIRNKRVSRVRADGDVEVVASPGGSPNGLAIGPDGAIYVCNSGGFGFEDIPGLHVTKIMQPPDYDGGRIERIDPNTGEVDVLYDSCGGQPLKGPNDLVFDTAGGIWFTDFGKQRERERDHGGIYYAQPDGSAIREVVYPLDQPNGIGLSPDGSVLYAAETVTGRVWAWDVAEPGRLANEGEGPGNGGRLLVGLSGFQLLDSLAVDRDGFVVVGTLVNGGLTVVAPDGSSVEHVRLPDPVVTNVCFGGEDLRTAFVTLSATGKLVSIPWPRPGLELAF